MNEDIKQTNLNNINDNDNDLFSEGESAKHNELINMEENSSNDIKESKSSDIGE